MTTIERCFKSGDSVQIKRSNGVWTAGEIMKIDYIKELYVCQFGGSNIKNVPFGIAGHFLRPIDHDGMTNDYYRTKKLPNLSSQNSSSTYREGDTVEILRSNGQWQEARITKVDTKDDYYACEWFDGAKKIPFHSASSAMRLPSGLSYCRSLHQANAASNLDFLSSASTSDPMLLDQYKSEVRELELSIANLTLRLDQTVSTGNYSNAADLQKILKKRQMKLRHARRQFEEAKKASCDLKEFNAKNEKLKHQVQSLESHCSSLSRTMNDYVTHEDYQNASQIQKLLKNKQQELLHARRELEMVNNNNRRYPVNENRGVHNSRVNENRGVHNSRVIEREIARLEKENAKFNNELAEALHFKDSARAGELQKRIAYIEAQLAQTRKNLQ